MDSPRSNEKKSSPAASERILPSDLRADGAERKTSLASIDGTLLNATGHRDQLRRQYSLLSICGVGLTIDNAWIAFGGSLVVSVLNGGSPGILYEFIVACTYYAPIGASIAELASSIPSSGGVYHWSSITPGIRSGRIVGFFCGWLNFFGWMFDLAAIGYIPANVAVQMYAVLRPKFVNQPWHSYLAFVLITWLCTIFVIFFNRFIPYLQHAGVFLITSGRPVSVIVVVTMPARHASDAFVWKDFQTKTCWSDGIAFLTGVLNGASTIGTPDAVTHLAEELPNPKVDLPEAVFAQVGLGFVTAFVYAIAIFYGVNDLNKVSSSNSSFPIAEVYLQGTGSPIATFGLLVIILLSITICAIGTILMLGRIWRTLARDNATPFATFFSTVDERRSCPIPSTICALLTTGFGAIQLGSATALTSLAGSFIILTNTSYFLAIFLHIPTQRSNVPKGWFWKGRAGYLVNRIAGTLIVFNIFSCFLYAYSVKPLSLVNWNSLILGGIVLLTTFWWAVHGIRKYPGPKLARLYMADL